MKPGPKTRAVALYVAAWLGFLVLYTLGMRQTSATSYPQAFVEAVTFLFPGFLLGGVLWRASALLMSGRELTGGVLTLQVVMVAVYAVLWEILFFAFLFAVGGRKAFEGVFHQVGVWALLFNIGTGAILVTIFHSIRVQRELREKERARAESDRLRAKAEMEALRGQLSPHFLFNSLHSITALVRDDPARAEEALLQFAALLRRLLDVRRDASDEVLLREELRFVEDYLAIESLRLGNRLRVERSVEPAALDCWLPAFSVQPFVENAIRHAIANRKEGGRLFLEAHLVDGNLVVTVRDDGPGALQTDLHGSGGIGLAAVRRRLALRHGDAAALEVETESGLGFRVRMSMPAMTEPLMEAVP